ncbi:MAG: hypothetical protein ACNI27_14365 [Desulfovibrio sp.]
MIFRFVTVCLMVFSLVGCLGKSQNNIIVSTTPDGKTTTYSTKDDVSIFSAPPAQAERVTRGVKDQESLEKVLQKMVDDGMYNSAAFLAGHAPAKYDVFLQKWIEERINDLPPSFMFALVRKYDATDTVMALQWFQRGFILSRLDGKMCLDRSASQGVMFLNSMIGENLRAKMEEYQQSDVFYEEGAKAVEYARAYTPSYNPMWICSHGISSFTEGGNDGFKPKEERSEVIESVISHLTLEKK